MRSIYNKKSNLSYCYWLLHMIKMLAKYLLDLWRAFPLFISIIPTGYDFVQRWILPRACRSCRPNQDISSTLVMSLNLVRYKLIFTAEQCVMIYSWRCVCFNTIRLSCLKCGVSQSHQYFSMVLLYNWKCFISNEAKKKEDFKKKMNDYGRLVTKIYISGINNIYFFCF